MRHSKKVVTAAGATTAPLPLGGDLAAAGAANTAAPRSPSPSARSGLSTQMGSGTPGSTTSKTTGTQDMESNDNAAPEAEASDGTPQGPQDLPRGHADPAGDVQHEGANEQ